MAPSAPADSAASLATPDIAAIESTLTRFSLALATADGATLHALTSPDFMLNDRGRTYDCAGLIESIGPLVAGGGMTRTPEHIRTTVRGPIAWAQYDVSGELRGADGVQPLSLLEVAFLERTGAGWRVALMTTLPAGE